MREHLKIQAYELLIEKLSEENAELLRQIDKVAYQHLPALRKFEEFIYDRHGYHALYGLTKEMDDEYTKEHGKAYGYADYVSENYDQDE